MHLRRLLVVAALGLPLAVPAEDLLEVYALARSADPLLATEFALRGIQHELALQARSGLLPQWSVEASDTRIQGDGARVQELTSTLSQALLDLGRWRTWDAARTDVSAQDARVRAAEQDLCARVARAYFGVLLAQAGVATAQANEDAYAVQVGQAQARFEAGLSASVDVDQARAFLELARGATVAQRQALADTREALAQITGRLPGALKTLAPDLPGLAPEPREPQPWVERALAANPALLAQQLGLTASEQRIGAARAAHWPTVSVGVDSDRRNGIAETSRTETLVALRLKVPLFAGGATESQVRQAAFQRDAQREALETTRRGLVRETQAQYQAVLAGAAQMESARAAAAAADRALVSTRAGIALGTRTMTDLLLAIQTQATAQNAVEQARHAYMLSKLLLLQAAGSLGEAELAAVNQLLQ